MADFISVRGTGWRISQTAQYGPEKPWVAYWAGSRPPSGAGEDLVPFPTPEAAGEWLKKKGAKASEVRQGLAAINCTPPNPSVFQVCEKMCPECLFTPAKIVDDVRKQDILDNIEKGNGNYFVCHKGSLTGNNQLCCRGWYDANPQAPIVVLAKELKLVRFVPVPKLERNDD